MMLIAGVLIGMVVGSAIMFVGIGIGRGLAEAEAGGGTLYFDSEEGDDGNAE